MNKKKHEISDELLEQLLAMVEDPKELLGSEGLLRQLTARLVEKSLEAELGEHLGYEKGGSRLGENARNGSSSKTLLTGVGKVEVQIPRDREGSFEPQLVPKHQRRGRASTSGSWPCTDAGCRSGRSRTTSRRPTVPRCPRR